MILTHIRPNFTKLETKNLEVWFSYETPIAFRYKNKLIVSENLWGPTTGKHLNYLCDKENRVIRSVFEKEFNKVS